MAQALSQPFPLNLIQFASVAAQGANIVSSIRSIRSAVSGGNSSSSATSTSSLATPSASSFDSAASDQQIGRIAATPSAGLQAATSGATSSVMPAITFVDNVGIGVNVGRITADEVEIMIEDRAQQTEANAAQNVPNIVAGQLAGSNSTITRAVTTNTTTSVTRP